MDRTFHYPTDDAGKLNQIRLHFAFETKKDGAFYVFINN